MQKEPPDEKTFLHFISKSTDTTRFVGTHFCIDLRLWGYLYTGPKVKRSTPQQAAMAVLILLLPCLNHFILNYHRFGYIQC